MNNIKTWNKNNTNPLKRIRLINEEECRDKNNMHARPEFRQVKNKILRIAQKSDNIVSTYLSKEFLKDPIPVTQEAITFTVRVNFDPCTYTWLGLGYVLSKMNRMGLAKWFGWTGIGSNGSNTSDILTVLWALKFSQKSSKPPKSLCAHWKLVFWTYVYFAKFARTYMIFRSYFFITITTTAYLYLQRSKSDQFPNPHPVFHIYYWYIDTWSGEFRLWT